MKKIVLLPLLFCSVVNVAHCDSDIQDNVDNWRSNIERCVREHQKIRERCRKTDPEEQRKALDRYLRDTPGYIDTLAETAGALIEMVEIQHTLQTSAHDNGMSQEAREALKEEKSELEKKYKKYKKKYEDVKKEYKDIEYIYEYAKNKYKDLNATYGSLDQAYQTLTSQYQQIQQAYSSLKMEYDKLQQTQQNHTADPKLIAENRQLQQQLKELQDTIEKWTQWYNSVKPIVDLQLVIDSFGGPQRLYEMNALMQQINKKEVKMAYEEVQNALGVCKWMPDPTSYMKEFIEKTKALPDFLYSVICQKVLSDPSSGVRINLLDMKNNQQIYFPIINKWSDLVKGHIDIMEDGKMNQTEYLKAFEALNALIEDGDITRIFEIPQGKYTLQNIVAGVVAYIQHHPNELQNLITAIQMGDDVLTSLCSFVEVGNERLLDVFVPNELGSEFPPLHFQSLNKQLCSLLLQYHPSRRLVLDENRVEILPSDAEEKADAGVAEDNN